MSGMLSWRLCLWGARRQWCGGPGAGRAFGQCARGGGGHCGAMTLIPAVLADPQSPPALLACLADAALTAPLAHRDHLALLAHPHLPPGHPVLAGERTPRRALERLSANADASAGDVLEAVRLNQDAGPAAAMSVAVARVVARHPATPPGVALQGLRVLLRARRVRARDHGWLITAALRHPPALLELAGAAGDARIARELHRYAATTHPGGPLGARAADVAARATATGTPAAWADALRDAPLPAVLDGVVLSYWAVRAILSSGYATRELRTAAATAFTRATPGSSGSSIWVSAEILGALPRDVLVAHVAAVARQGNGVSIMMNVPLRADLTGGDLDALWGALLAVQHGPAGPSAATWLPKLADFALKLALHPAASPDLRERLRTHVQHFADAPASLNVPWFSATTAATAMQAAARGGPGAAGRSVPVADLRLSRPGYMVAEVTYRPAVSAALRERHDLLADPAGAQAFWALAKDFPGTVGQLLSTVEGVRA